MIKSFRDSETEKIYNRERSKKLPPNIQQVALRKLRMINNAKNLGDLRVPPANRLEKLAGKRAGQYSIRVNDQWRVCFEWQDSDAFNVEIADYHLGYENEEESIASGPSWRSPAWGIP